jgi:hypothetical protein
MGREINSSIDCGGVNCFSRLVTLPPPLFARDEENALRALKAEKLIIMFTKCSSFVLFFE